MAVELRHLDCTQSNNYSTVEVLELYSKNVVKVNIWDESLNNTTSIILDISTAIRLSKTIRTAINKAKEGVHQNG